MARKITAEQVEADRRVLELLSQTFSSVSAASTEIINLEAILNLPKGTEHFVADLHGEHEAFRHILKNASGNIKRKVKDLFGQSMRENEIRELCTLIYYPERKLEYLKSSEPDLENFYTITLHRLVQVCREVSSKYTRSKVRKALPREFAYIIEELLHESEADTRKAAYFSRIIETIIITGQADEFIRALCNVIQRLSIDRLHILGDIFDRGPGAHIIMDTLCDYGRFDIQWGNHDALWMGAAAGNDCCIANVLRLSLRYANLTTLEDGYGINLVPLATFAMETYGNDPCECFLPKIDADRAGSVDEKTRMLWARMHKAISIIQFKLEAAMIDSRPQWQMADRKVLDHIDFATGEYVDPESGRRYVMTDTNLPTVDPTCPSALTDEERELVARLNHSFVVNPRLRRHINCLLDHGCLYTVTNSNLLFHASLPLNADGSLRQVDLNGQSYSGRELMHRTGMLMRSAFNTDTDADGWKFAIDYFWYLWCGPQSLLFDKSKMATFERYFLTDTATHHEEKGWYYKLRDSTLICDRILDEFGVTGQHRHIINGHVPVRAAKGESPVKADGRLMVIDGGFAKAYHHTTGIAGYTLVFHSRGFELVQHEPFESAEDAIAKGTDIVSTTRIVEMNTQRMRVRDTDMGRELQSQIDELMELLYAYRHGIIRT